MPTYDYHCLTCGHRFEYFQSITSDALPHCPRNECIQQEEDKKGTGEVIRMVSGGIGLVFKGTGFYQTDYKKDGGGGRTEGGGEKGGGEKGGGTGGSTEGGGEKGGGGKEGGKEGGSSSVDKGE